MDGKALGDNPRRARALIVGDDTNKMHLIAPDAAIVDLTVLSNWSGRQLRTESFEPIAAIPGFYEHPLVVDRRVAEWDRLALATERPDEYVTLTHAEFNRGAAKASVVDFCIDIGAEPTPRQPHDDRERVIASITAFTELRIRQRLDQTLTIPPLPEATRRILELKADPDFNLRDLTRVVEADPSLSARIIGWANSAYYGLREPVHVDLRCDPARHGSAGNAEHGVGDCPAAGPQGAESARARLVALLAASDVHRGNDGSTRNAGGRTEATAARLLLPRRFARELRHARHRPCVPAVLCLHLPRAGSESTPAAHVCRSARARRTA